MLTVALVAACAPPDTPPALRSALPDAVLDLLRPDTVRTVELHPAVRYRYLWSSVGPWAVHLVDARLPARCELAVEVLQADARTAGGQGRETVSGMVARAGGLVLAAVNADFFTPEGEPVGTEIVAGVVTSRGTRPVFAWRPGRVPWTGTVPVREGALRPGWSGGRVGDTGVLDRADPVAGEEPAAPATMAVGGFPDLIDAGRRVGDLEVSARPSFAAARHPRTAVGYDLDSGRVWLVVVDGRQPPHSTGMTLPELADLFEALGAEEAINLDGGGSTTLVLDGQPVNRPSDAAGERPVVNALAVVRAPEGCR